MVPRMGPMSPVRAHSLWAGLCPEKLVKNKLKLKNKLKNHHYMVIPDKNISDRELQEGIAH